MDTTGNTVAQGKGNHHMHVVLPGSDIILRDLSGVPGIRGVSEGAV
jgi:hypothetical protein